MSFKVAILGSPRSSGDVFWSNLTYGIQVYDLAAEQICSILHSPEHSNGIDVAKLGAIPVNKYEIYGGGRFFPSVTREASIYFSLWQSESTLWLPCCA
ncbi:hypothetical protein GBAR_LOCUS14652 [Geodia barretti]|uniref:Uncharacterized protein n=1 Tax=Geodia barretti TaxID=519541 RepID=A0AA35S8Z1_GEOBA|nr:hypothetical protein GBAR_LOCUS14652 [Geodia barretti]